MTKAETAFFRNLSMHLASLFDLPSIPTVVADAGLEWSRIDQSGTPYDVWTHVVAEARKSNRGLMSLMQAAIRLYPENQRLIELFTEMPAVDSVAVGIDGMRKELSEMRQEQKVANQKIEAIDRKVSAQTLQINGISQQVAGLSAQVVAT